MSNFGAPGQHMDDVEIERQLAEEFRRRQALQAAGVGGQYSALAARRPEYAHMLQDATGAGTTPYYATAGGTAAAPGVAGGTTAAHPHHASPYTQVTNPYGGLAEARAAYRGTATTPGTGASTEGPLAALYAAQQQRRQQTMQQAYGYAPGAAAGRTALEQHYAAYGMTPAPYASAPHDYGAAPAPSSHSPHELAQQQQAHLTDPYQVLKSTSNPPVASYTGSSMKPSPVQGSDEARPASGEKEKPKAGRKISKSKPVFAPEERLKKPKPTARLTVKDGTTIIEDGNQQWYTGSVPLGVEDDKYWLSELQVYLRSNFAEAFGATEDDIAAPMHGRNKPIALGQVGIRCMHCKQDNPAERGQQATSYPSLISGIYNSVQQMLRLHLDCCLSMPPDVRAKIEQLKVSCSSRGGRKQYWIDSAKRLGLVDTPHGIHFGRDPMGPLPPLTGPSVNSKEGRNKKKNPPKASAPAPKKQEAEAPPEEEALPPPPPVDSRPLVFPEDKDLISDYLYLTLEQMAPCLLMEADRVGCYKTRKVGFPGLACKHCVGQAGCGRYFPASEASLSQTTTSQTIMNHVRNCRRCPIEIRENLELMKRNRMGPDGKRSDKPKHGGRKVFFHRLWCRIQDIPFDEGKAETKESKKRKKKLAAAKKKKKKAAESDHESEGDEMSSEEETESEEESESSDDEDMDSKPKSKRKSTGPSSAKKKKASPWFDGCVRLTKTDDAHWLSEMECFARSDLVEVFSLKKKDALDGYAGRKEPAPGQVGIRCIFCKTLDPSERPNGCLSFPEKLSAIQTKMADMIRLHFPSCPSMPDDVRETFKSYRGFDAKVANDDSAQYWVDSARDIGLANAPPEDSSRSWGITFRRDPLQPSPADELDLEQSTGAPAEFGKNSLVREEDRGACTDQVMLLLRQVRPCRFKNSDRRAGPGSRGRDRSLDFPGLCCMHCVGRNTLGRYFPMNAKNLTDSTTNSLAAHVSSCAQCPEPIKASLSYLSHRSILQKAELPGSWKKAFFKKVWDRLHVERDWTSIDDEEGVAKLEYSSGEEQAGEGDDDGEGKDDDEDGSGSDKEEMGENMNALIKAAAIWLTKSDNADGKGGTRAAKGKRSAGGGASGGGREGRGLPTKRRRGNQK